MPATDQESPFMDLNLMNRRVMGGGGPDEDNRWPPWLQPLLSASFFVQCDLHADTHKGECNMYCLDCMNGALCSICLDYHRGHHAIQIRRSSYHDVIRVNEIQKVLDISGVQTYVINSARVVFLNERPQQRPGKGAANNCEACDRSLLDSFRFCSLGCKIAGTATGFNKRAAIAEKNDKSKSRNKNKKKKAMEESDSEGSYTSNVTQGMTPSTPPPTTLSFRSTKRRKGVPHRAPFGSLTLEHVDYCSNL